MQFNTVTISNLSLVTSSLLLGVGLLLSNSAQSMQPGATPLETRTAPPLPAQVQLEQVTAAAKRDFAEFVQHTVQAHANGMQKGFPLEITDVQDLKSAAITYGFQVFTIDPKDIVAGRSELSSMVKPTGIWRFVISLKDHPIGLATVEQVGGKWEIVSYGAATLSQDLDAMVVRHANADRSNLRFIRIYQAQSDFLEVVSMRDSKIQFAPLHSARASLLLPPRMKRATDGTDNATEDLIDPADLLEPLRTAVKTHMSAFH